MRRLARVAAVVSAAALLGAPGSGSAQGRAPEVVATGIPRPLQLVVDGRSLVVLSPGTGDVAGELYRVDLDAELPVDLARAPRLRIPFADDRRAALGSLARDPTDGALLLGEENGARIWRLDGDGRLTLFADGLHRLAGGSTLVVDPRGRLLVVDYVNPALAPPEKTPPELRAFREEDYRGPLVFRLSLDPSLPLPRHLIRRAPLFPRGWGGPAGGGLLPLLVAVTTLGPDDLALVASSGSLYRLRADRRLVPFVRLPVGQYLRINLAAGDDGVLWVSSGFWVTRLFRVSPGGEVTTVASALADPQGLALGGDGFLYLAESARHRIVRVRAR